MPKQILSLSQIKEIDAAGLDALVARLKNDDQDTSKKAGVYLAQQADSFGISIKDFLRLSIKAEPGKDGLNGYEQMLMKLNLPTRDDFDNGIYLQAASDTFQTHAGTRALFPEVIDDVLRWAGRQEQVESVLPFLANSRTINGVEMLSTVVDNDLLDGENDTFQVPELGRIPVRTIKTSETAVKIWKHGSALRTSYEFQRRASLELMKPHAARIGRELERSKAAAGTLILLNGDGAYGAANVVEQSDYNTVTGVTATNGKISWPHFMYWLVQRAKAGVPVDTVVMNWDAMFQWMMMFGVNSANVGPTAAQSLAQAGVDIGTAGQVIALLSRITPVISSTVPANKMIGITKADTLEELREAGSDINETERAILNQSITMTKTENTGYHLVYGDTREVYDFGN